jgi:Acetyltransferases
MRCACEAKVEIRASSVDEMRRHGEALFRAHFEEIATNQDSTTLDPDWRHYELIEQAGLIFTLAAWHVQPFGALEPDKLCGYSANLLIPEHLHYKALRYVSNDVLYVHPDYRGGSVAGRLMRATRDAARARGAKRLCWHAKKGTALDAILGKRETCIVQDIIYSEIL